MDENQEREDYKNNLMNDIMLTAQSLDKMWKFHPNNPKGVDIVKEYAALEGYLKSLQEDYDALEKM